MLVVGLAERPLPKLIYLVLRDVLLRSWPHPLLFLLDAHKNLLVNQHLSLQKVLAVLVGLGHRLSQAAIRLVLLRG